MIAAQTLHHMHPYPLVGKQGVAHAQHDCGHDLLIVVLVMVVTG